MKRSVKSEGADAVGLAPRSGVSLRLGSVLLELQRFDDAAAHAMLAEKTNFGGAHLLLARIAIARKDLPRAEAESRLAQRDASTRVQEVVCPTARRALRPSCAVLYPQRRNSSS